MERKMGKQRKKSQNVIDVIEIDYLFVCLYRCMYACMPVWIVRLTDCFCLLSLIINGVVLCCLTTLL